MEAKKFSPSRRVLPIFLSLLLAICLLAVAVIPGQAYGVPLISIVSVNKDVSVTISGSYFPSGRVFTVRMGPYGTLAIGGTVVGTYDSTYGSSFVETYTIPSELVGADRIAIRMDSYDGYYSFNWFVNDPDAVPTTAPYPPAAPPGYSGYPTVNITSVTAGSSVTVKMYNMPVGQSFTVRMGDYGTYAIGGTVVGTTSDKGGTFSETYDIPSWLAGNYQIAIRLDGPTGYYAYNWFYNNTTSDVSVSSSTPVPGPGPIPGYTGYPSIYINAVVRDATVTVSGYNFPADQTFTVRMGAFGTLGIGGIVVASVDTGSGGNFSATYDIPDALAGSAKIAIRMENGYYYAFNWFYNNSTY